MPGTDVETGYYRKVKCPRCGRNVYLVIDVNQLQTRRKRTVGEIENILTEEGYERFSTLETKKRIIFCVGRFFDQYGRGPSGKELSRFIGLTEQTISKHLNENDVRPFICCSEQKKDKHGRYQEKRFCLTLRGKDEYGSLTYKMVGYT